MPIEESLRNELLAMARHDEEVRSQLAEDGSLYEGYHPLMRQLHSQNATRLEQIIDQYGWPGKSIAGEDGANAAWMIAQHAIAHPDFQRKVLSFLKRIQSKEEINSVHIAMLEDRVRSLEGRPQLYGTQFDWDEDGQMSPFPEIEDLSGVDERRAAMGLKPLSEAIAHQRKVVANSKEKPPKDLAKRRQEMDEWARSVGWR
jgi:hypothetical protein